MNDLSPSLKDIPRQRWLRIIPPILACIILYGLRQYRFRDAGRNG